MTLRRLILDKLRTQHAGRARAITRHDLRDYLLQVGHDIGDRDLRELYSELPCVSGQEGIWWPDTASEVEEFCDGLRKRVKSEMVRAAMVRRAHGHLFETRQMELPI
jgi:hypothetical protein